MTQKYKMPDFFTMIIFFSIMSILLISFCTFSKGIVGKGGIACVEQAEYLYCYKLGGVVKTKLMTYGSGLNMRTIEKTYCDVYGSEKKIDQSDKLFEKCSVYYDWFGGE